jgi:hypothetical protein
VNDAGNLSRFSNTSVTAEAVKTSKCQIWRRLRDFTAIYPALNRTEVGRKPNWTRLEPPSN